MLFVIVTLGQQPQLVPAVVEPLVLRGGDVFSCELWIDEEIGMPVEAHLHHAAAILRDDDELHPSIGNLLRLPPSIVNALYSTLHVHRGVGSCRSLCAGRRRPGPSKQDDRCKGRFSDVSRRWSLPPCWSAGHTPPTAPDTAARTALAANARIRYQT